MNSSTPKAKFLPPIKTAASFLRTLCKSPDVFSSRSPLPSPTSRFLEKDSINSTHLLKESGVFIERSNSNLTGKNLRISQFSFKNSKLISKNFKNFLLPTSIEKLRSLSKAGKQIDHLLNGKKKGHRFSEYSETSLEHFEEISVNNSKILSEQQFREWFEFMKSHYFDVFERSSDGDKVSLEEFKMITQVVQQEFFRVLAVLNNKIAAVFTEICRYLKIISKLKAEEKLGDLLQEKEKMIKKISEIEEKLKKQEEENKEKVDFVEFI
jgi:hypothetical protein